MADLRMRYELTIACGTGKHGVCDGYIYNWIEGTRSGCFCDCHEEVKRDD